MTITPVPTTGTERRTHTVVDSPVGPLTLMAIDGTLAGLYMTDQRHRPATETFGEPEPEPEPEPAAEAAGTGLFGEAARQLAAYFDGGLTRFDLPLDLRGTPFQRQVWAALREIPYGETISYRELAERIGNPAAVRAVGLANGRNPIGIIVPCHRVVGANGSLTGYGGGLPRKRQLLALERRVSGAALF